MPFDSGSQRWSRASTSAPRHSSVSEASRLYSVSLSELAKRPEFAGYYFKSSPYYVRWVHGYNHRVGAINLNDRGTTTLFYAASNFGVLYNWSTNNMRILQGHRHMVTCISADAEGHWLVTGDSGSENVVIIWNSKDVFPQRTIFSPHKNFKLAKLALSADAKFLLTLAYGEKAELNWWIWSFGGNLPDATIQASLKKDSVLHIEFNPYNSLQFVLMTKTDIWIGAAEKIFVNERGVIKETDRYELKLRMPERKQVQDVGLLTCLCFVQNSCQILVGTRRGGVLLYGYTMEYTMGTDASDINKLKYIKAMKIEKYRINTIKSIDGVIVTGNNGGEIHFYDHQLRLVYWVHGFKVDRVRALSFNVSPRDYVMHDPICVNPCECKCKDRIHSETKDKSVERQKLLKRKVATDATTFGAPFLVRDFIICTLNQGICFVQFAQERITTILDYKTSPALALTVHPDKKLIAIGYFDGNVELVSYTQHKLKMRLNLREFYKIVIPPKEDSIKGDYEINIPQLSVTCLKYSPSGLHLACGLNTGQLLFLDPTTIDIITKTPFKDTKFSINEINYSPDSLTLAFSDIGKTVCVYKYNCETFKWNFIGKHRAHYKDINSVFFLPEKNEDGEHKLLSFGADRVMVEYDIGASTDEYLEILSLDRVEQTGVPLTGIVWPTPKDLDEEIYNTKLPIVLIATDEHKYKIINYNTTMTLATYLGPRYEHPVKDMMLTYLRDEKNDIEGSYLLFATKNVIGLQKMPIDGNPWKHVGMLGHPNQLLNVCFRADSHTLFTIGAKDNCMTQWQANISAVEKTTKLGGSELDPYYCLIENGRPGWLFQEIRDLFYYIQILCQGTFSPAMRRVKDYIPIDSLPDLMRALGFFPSEYEVENLIAEARYKVFLKQPATEIDFEEFVKLYLNHRPAFLTTFKKITKAFKTFTRYTKRDGEFISRDNFITMLCQNGERFTKELSWYLLSILYGQSFEDRANSTPEDFSFLPSLIKISDVLTTIMGVQDFDAESDKQSLAMSGGGSASSRSSNESEEKFNFF